MGSAWQLPTDEASLFGKLPTVLDYVRVNHSYPAAIALDEWLSRALQDLTVASLSWPTTRHRFLFAPAGSAHAIVGTFGPSRDRAGRKFPLAVFAPLPVSALARNFAVLPLACEELFRAADQLLDDAASLSKDDAAERLRALPLPTPDALTERREALQNLLDQTSTQTFAAQLFGGSMELADAAFARAVQTLASAQAGAPERVIALDCPASDATEVGAWLWLAQSMLRWVSELPSFFWTTASAGTHADPHDSTEPGRLLLSLGTPLPALALWLADRKRKSDRLVSLSIPGAWETLSAPDPEPGADTPTAPSLWDKLCALSQEG